MSRRRYARRTGWLLIVVLGVALWWMLGDRLSLEQWVEHEQRVRDWTERQRVLAVFAGLAGLAVTSLVPGTPGKTIVYGWLFGFWLGLLLVNLGMTIGGCMAFLACRYLFRDAVRARWAVMMRRVNRALERGGSAYLLMSRLVMAPFTATNYVLSATAVRTRTFWWTTQVGILPANIVFVYAGSRLPSLQQIAEQGTSSLLSVELLLALVVLSVLPLLVRSAARWAWPKVVHDSPV